MSAPRVNAVGDLVLTDTRAMRALAEPARLALLDGLRREGPATATQLSAQSPQLEELERFGFVERVEVARETDAAPSRARPARILAYFLPEAR